MPARRLLIGLSLATCLAGLPAAHGAQPLGSGDSHLALDLMQQYCFKHFDDFSILDAVVTAQESNAVAATQEQVARVFAESDVNAHGYILSRQDALLWLTFSPLRTCAISGKTSDAPALVAAVTSGLETFPPHQATLAGVDMTTMRFSRTSPYRGSMLAVFIGRSGPQDNVFKIVLFHPKEVDRIVGDYSW